MGITRVGAALAWLAVAQAASASGAGSSDPTASTVPAPVSAEPAGYWTGPINSPVPATLTGGQVIHIKQLQKLLKSPTRPVVIDVSNSPRRPEGLAPGAPWLPLPHQAIPGSLWLPGVGMGEISPAVDSFFRERLAHATSHDSTRALIIYCHEHCWLSWNAAKRAISYGYHHVYWFPDGVEGWKQPFAVIEPALTPP